MERASPRRLLIAAIFAITALGGMIWYTANAPCRDSTGPGIFTAPNSQTNFGHGCVLVCGPDINAPNACHRVQHWELDGAAIVALGVILGIALVGVTLSALPALRARRA